MVEIIQNWLTEQNVNETLSVYITYAIFTIAVIILSLMANYIAKRFLLTAVSFFIKKSKTKWDDILVERKFFSRLSHLAPALVIYFTAYFFGEMEIVIQRLAMVYMMLAGLLVIYSFF